MPSTRPPLAGLRIVEFSAFVAAPSAGLALAQLGADVIRVDPPGGNIDAHRMPVNAEGASLYWASLNHGKRSVEIDPRSPQGRALIRALLAAPGDGGGIFLTNLGVDGELGYEALSAARPDLIMVQLSGSPDGANAVDFTVNCAAGWPMVTGDGRGAPVNHALPAWDLIAGQTLAMAILAAERHRRATGEGQLVRLALADVAFAATANLGYLADVEVNGRLRRPTATSCTAPTATRSGRPTVAGRWWSRSATGSGARWSTRSGSPTRSRPRPPRSAIGWTTRWVAGTRASSSRPAFGPGSRRDGSTRWPPRCPPTEACCGGRTATGRR
jgi:crotonobetainyl-CoA:carnitine CoA-transferase CaiB-like acyl-CoA transferase